MISTVPRTLSHGENTITKPCKIANVFNNYFVSAADTAKQNINYPHKHLIPIIPLKHLWNNSIFIQPTDSEEIANIISSLNINKVSGPFSISNKILILLKHDISKQLADLFKLSFSSGSFPSILKTAKVVPVLKKGSKLDCCYYCPISFLSNVGKILEKPMYKRVYNFVTENNIIYDFQFGFRQKFSTSHVVINLIENIRQALDEGYIRCDTFVDLQKVFDRVDHETLLSKLDYYGTRSISNNRFKSCLSNHKQFVSINGYDSGLAEINCGVPQGSVLGPLLFLLYINYLNQAIKFCKVHRFADDYNLLYLGKSLLKNLRNLQILT